MDKNSINMIQAIKIFSASPENPHLSTTFSNAACQAPKMCPGVAFDAWVSQTRIILDCYNKQFVFFLHPEAGGQIFGHNGTQTNSTQI